MPYAKLLRENLSFKSIASTCWKLMPYNLEASFKLASLLLIFNFFAFIGCYNLFNGENYKLFVSGAVFLFAFCVIVNYILAYGAIKVMLDGVNGLKQDVLGSVIFTIKKIGPILASSILIVLSIYFIMLPSIYLPEPWKEYYLLAAAFIYLFFIPYIIFFPWLILVEDKNIFDSFRESYHLVKDRWFKYALLFFVSSLVVFFFVVFLIIVAIGIVFWLNNGEVFDFFRVNQFLGATMPLNVKAAILLSLLSGYSLKFQISLAFLGLFVLYTSIYGINSIILVLAAGYKAIKDYNLVVAEQKAASVKEDIFEITEFFRNTKEITIDSSDSEEFSESANGPQSRREMLRQFNKEEEETMPSYGKIKPPMREYPDPE